MLRYVRCKRFAIRCTAINFSFKGRSNVHYRGNVFVNSVILPFRRCESNMIKLETLGSLVVYKRSILKFVEFAHNDLFTNKLAWSCGFENGLTLRSVSLVLNVINCSVLYCSKEGTNSLSESFSRIVWMSAD